MADKCRVCGTLFGPMNAAERTAGKHELCAWMTWSDWEALRPWFSGTGHGAEVSGA